MSVSVLLPSRDNPEGFRRVCQNLCELASHPSQFEIVAMVDSDDPKIEEYAIPWECSNIRVLFIKNSSIKGYGNLHLMFDECARHASGDVLMAYNDDVLCDTRGWDEVYTESAKLHPLFPKRSIVQGDHYQWAFPAITREIYNRVGAFCPFGVENFDRVWDATAHHMPGIISVSSVVLIHLRTPPDDGREDRKEFCRKCINEWTEREKLWDETGRKTADILK